MTPYQVVAGGCALEQRELKISAAAEVAATASPEVAASPKIAATSEITTAAAIGAIITAVAAGIAEIASRAGAVIGVGSFGNVTSRIAGTAR
jgi:hypothetical protein